TVHVGTRFAEPPPQTQQPILVTPPPDDYVPPPPVNYDRDLYRSPFRLHLGPTAVTTGRGLGLGLGVAADFGRGAVGFRLAAAWMRGEPSSSDLGRVPSPLGDGLAQYTGELTLDFNKRGPVHPVFGLGFGLAHVGRGDSSGNLGIGTARLGLEYAL